MSARSSSVESAGGSFGFGQIKRIARNEIDRIFGKASGKTTEKERDLAKKTSEGFAIVSGKLGLASNKLRKAFETNIYNILELRNKEGNFNNVSDKELKKEVRAVANTEAIVHFLKAALLFDRIQKERGEIDATVMLHILGNGHRYDYDTYEQLLKLYDSDEVITDETIQEIIKDADSNNSDKEGIEALEQKLEEIRLALEEQKKIHEELVEKIKKLLIELAEMSVEYNIEKHPEELFETPTTLTEGEKRIEKLQEIAQELTELYEANRLKLDELIIIHTELVSQYEDLARKLESKGYAYENDDDFSEEILETPTSVIEGEKRIKILQNEVKKLREMLEISGDVKDFVNLLTRLAEIEEQIDEYEEAIELLVKTYAEFKTIDRIDDYLKINSKDEVSIRSLIEKVDSLNLDGSPNNSTENEEEVLEESKLTREELEKILKNVEETQVSVNVSIASWNRDIEDMAEMKKDYIKLGPLVNAIKTKFENMANKFANEYPQIIEKISSYQTQTSKDMLKQIKDMNIPEYIKVIRFDISNNLDKGMEYLENADLDKWESYGLLVQKYRDLRDQLDARILLVKAAIVDMPEKEEAEEVKEEQK